MSKEERPVLYLNIIVLDASEAVKAKVQEKIHASKRIPSPLKKSIGKRVANIAASRATPSVVAEKLGPILSEKMPEKMQEKGLTVEVVEVFQEGPYVVMQVQVLRVDTVLLADTRLKKQETSDSTIPEWIDWFLNLFGLSRRRTVEDDILPGIIQRKLETIMGDIMTEKMAERNLKAYVEVLPEAKQARYFYSQLKRVREDLADDDSSGKRHKD